MSALIQESVKPLQTSVDALHEMVNHFNARLAVAAEFLWKTVKMLQAQNKSLQDRLNDL